MKHQKITALFLLLALLTTLLAGCGQGSAKYLGFKLENKVDLNDLKALDKTFIDTLYALNNVWFYNWNTPSEMKADELMIACGMGNYLGLERDEEGKYSKQTAAGLVENAMFERFGVAADQLRTSQYYNAKENIYQLIGGGGGGWNAEAMSATQTGDLITIQIGIFHSNEWPVTAGDIKKEDGFTLTPKGTLTVELTGDHFKYVSYVLYDNSADSRNLSSISASSANTSSVAGTYYSKIRGTVAEPTVVEEYYGGVFKVTQGCVTSVEDTGGIAKGDYLYGVQDINGNTIAGPIYDGIAVLSENRVCVNFMWGAEAYIYDDKGNVISNNEYHEILFRRESKTGPYYPVGFATERNAGNSPYCLVDFDGKKVIPTKFMHMAFNDDNQTITVDDGTKSYVIDFKGNYIKSLAERYSGSND